MPLPDNLWEGLFEQYRGCFSSSSEASDDFHYAIFLSIVGTIIGRRAYVYYARELYPNFFTIIEGSTGTARKTTAMRFGEKILEQFPEVKRSWGISSAEGLIRVMGGYSPDDGMEKAKDRSTLLIIEEFATLLRKGKQESLVNLPPMITSLYDSPSRIDLPTRKRPLVLEKPFLSILSGTTPDWLESSMSEEEVMGGFANRFIYVIGDPKPHISHPPKPSKANIDDICQKIKTATDKCNGGQIPLSPQSFKVWDNFYTQWVKKKRSGIVEEMVQRIPEYALKAALVHTILKEQQQIEVDDVYRGIKFAGVLEQNVDFLFGTFPLSQWGKVESKIIQLLKIENPRSRREIHQRIGGRVAADRLNRIIQGLEANEVIKSMNLDGKTYIRLIKPTEELE